MRKRLEKMITLVLIVMAVTGMYIQRSSAGPVTAGTIPAEALQTVEIPLYDLSRETGDQDWRLILVNAEHPLPEDYQADLLMLSNGQQVDKRIYPELQEMFDTARAGGMELFVREGYRTHEEQQMLFDEKMEAFLAEGYSQKEAEELTKSWVAVPGTSEHELGLSVDINPDLDISTCDEVYGWLEDNSYRFGFIKRYPSDKSDITGINDEPWHFRYVGYDAAKEMYMNGLCLEEYLERQRDK